MIGCTARAVTTELNVDRTELEDARWFTRDEVLAMFKDAHPQGYRSPNGIAIAHHLLGQWAFGKLANAIGRPGAAGDGTSCRQAPLSSDFGSKADPA